MCLKKSDAGTGKLFSRGIDSELSLLARFLFKHIVQDVFLFVKGYNKKNGNETVCLHSDLPVYAKSLSCVFL